jgi:hypothetical protein
MIDKNTIEAIMHLVPNPIFSITNNEFTWQDDRPQPTQEEIDATVIQLPAIEAEKAKRATRNSLLAMSDWTVLPDSPISESEQAAWISYRQELRDFPSQNGWVDLEFPAKPE